MSLDIWSTIIIQIIRNINTSVHSDNFTKHNASQHVYAVSVQALSTPSALSGPVTVRGQLEYNEFGSKYTPEKTFSVPGHVQDLLYIVEIVMDDSLSISWERPAQPNDYTLIYTISVTDISTDTELSRIVLNETQIIVTLPHTHCMDTYNVQYFFYSERNSIECHCVCY